MYVVYVIKSVNRNFTYVGLTENLERRVFQHNNGRGRSTKPYAPFTLIYTEICDTRSNARLREKYLKSTAGKNYLQKVLAANSLSG